MARLIKHTKYRKYLIATAILLMVVVGISAFPSQSLPEEPTDSVTGQPGFWYKWNEETGEWPITYIDPDLGLMFADPADYPCETIDPKNRHSGYHNSWWGPFGGTGPQDAFSSQSQGGPITSDCHYRLWIHSNGQLQLLDSNREIIQGRSINVPSTGGSSWLGNLTGEQMIGYEQHVTSNITTGLFHLDDCPGTYYIQSASISAITWPPPGLSFPECDNSAPTPTPQPTATPAPTSPPSSSGASLTGTTSMSGSGNTAVQVSITSGSTSVASDTTTPTPAPLYLRSAGATPFPSIPKYGTPIPTPSISTSQPYIMLKNPKGRYITTSEPVGTEINIVGGNFPGKSEIESMWFTPVDPPYGEPIDITPQTKYFDIWSLSYKYQKNQTDKSGVVNETIIVPDAPPGLYYIELTARKVLGTTAKTQSTLFRIPGEPDLTAPVPYAIPDPYPTSTPYPIPVQVRAQRNISFDTQTRNSMKYDIDFGPNKICSDDL